MLEHLTVQLNCDTLPTPSHVNIRAFHHADQRAVLHLFMDGLLGGETDPGDPATDLADIEAAYFRHSADHFWVAEMEDEIVGTVGLTTDANQIAHVRRLRVAPGWQEDNSILLLLIGTATAHARDHDCLKLILHTPLDDRKAIPIFHQIGFEFVRGRNVHGLQMLEFYLNLYTQPPQLQSELLDCPVYLNPQ